MWLLDFRCHLHSWPHGHLPRAAHPIILRLKNHQLPLLPPAISPKGLMWSSQSPLGNLSAFRSIDLELYYICNIPSLQYLDWCWLNNQAKVCICQRPGTWGGGDYLRFLPITVSVDHLSGKLLFSSLFLDIWQVRSSVWATWRLSSQSENSTLAFFPTLFQLAPWWFSLL